VARDRRTITVHGSVAAGIAGTVTVRVSARIGGRSRSVTRTITLRRGRYSARLRLASTRWRTAKVTVRYAGSGRRAAATVARTVSRRTG